MQYQGVLKAHATSRNRLSAVEIKILFVIFYYALFSVVVIIQAEAGQETDTSYSRLLQDYFSCEAKGINRTDSRSCSKRLSAIQNHTHNVLLVPVVLLLVCIPIVNLVFILSWRAVGSAALSFVAAFCKRAYNGGNGFSSYPTN